MLLKCKCVVGILAIAVLAGPLGGAPRIKDKSDEKLVGSWKQTHVEFEGHDNTEGERATRNHWVITDSTISIYTRGKYNDQWTYRLDSAKGPAAIDLTTKSGGTPVTYPCIYKIEGDELTFCLQNYPEKGRPQSFESKPGSGVGKFVYVRVNAGDEKAPALREEAIASYSSSSRNLANTPISSSVVVSCVVARPAAMSRSGRRMIFPERVFGSVGVKRISSGRANAPISFVTWSRSSFFSSSVPSIPTFSVTNAAIPSPLISSGLPTTAASATFA